MTLAQIFLELEASPVKGQSLQQKDKKGKKAQKTPKILISVHARVKLT